MGELANATELKKADIILNTLAEIGTAEVKKSGKPVLPGLCMLKHAQDFKPLKKACSESQEEGDVLQVRKLARDEIQIGKFVCLMLRIMTEWSLLLAESLRQEA